MILSNNQSICAISTASGNGAIAIIRISGNEAFAICDKIIELKSGKQLLALHSHSSVFGYIIDNKSVIDEVVISIFKNPKSYTGEDTVEISCHGSIYIQQRIMELLLRNGARLAQPGEFTLRAFMNGKLDLSQAEAVGDLIASQNQTSHQLALNQMRGGFSNQLNELRNKLLHFISLIELELDFSEEDVEFANRNEFKELILEINKVCKSLSASFKLGNVIKNGLPVAIVGKPNSGKSTLLNALLNEEKAIVSEIPGTTRDVIEDVINIEGIQVRFIDTAGIRDTTDTIETLGIEKTFEKIKKATIILLITDVSDNIEDIHNQLKRIQLSKNQTLAVILNKADKISADELKNKEILMADLPFTSISISAKHKQNINAIHSYILQAINFKKLNDNDIIITNARHFEALENTYFSGQRIVEGLESHLPSDLLAEDIREMLRFIGEITGEITNDEILGNIFKNFCIGK